MSLGRSLDPVLIPLVPELDTYDLKTAMGGSKGYTQIYKVYSRSIVHQARLDEEAQVHIVQKPDGVGNVRSPMATCMEAISFTDCLTELALCAEISNARPSITTQAAPERADEQNMPFDTEGRGVATDLESCSSDWSCCRMIWSCCCRRSAGCMGCDDGKALVYGVLLSMRV